MSPSDGDRRRTAVLLLFAGMSLVLLATGAYISCEQRRLPRPTTQLTEARKAELRDRVRTPLRILIAAAGLTLAFVIALYAFLSWSRGYRARLARRPPRPTPVEDIWSMHKVPDEPESPDEPGNTPGESDYRQ